MDVIPAIDIRGGKAVRLYQGDYARETVFDDDPVGVAQQWEAQGALRIHVVDLDGAREGSPVQADLIGDITRAVSVPVQAGGGVRTMSDIETMLTRGADRVVLGTVAVEEPDLIRAACERYGDRIIAGLDARDGRVAVRGWLEDTSVDTRDLAHRLVELGVRRFIQTDIARDGTLEGPNVSAMEALAHAVAPVPVVASGGVSNADDIRRLFPSGVEAVIVGRALYTGALTLPDALRAANAPTSG